MKPLSTVALVCHSTDVGPGDFTVTKQPTVLGTCFAFRYPTTFLTARHVFRRVNPQELAISFLTIPGLWKEVEETEGPDGRPVRKIAGEGRVNYGIAVILAEILDWLNERVPPRSPDSFLRPPIPTR